MARSQPPDGSGYVVLLNALMLGALLFWQEAGGKHVLAAVLVCTAAFVASLFVGPYVALVRHRRKRRRELCERLRDADNEAEETSH